MNDSVSRLGLSVVVQGSGAVSFTRVLKLVTVLKLGV